MPIQLSGSLLLTGSIVATGGITMSGSIASASFAVQAQTASSADNLTVRSTLTAQTLVVQTITSSVDYITGSSINGSLLSNTHQVTGSMSVTGSIGINVGTPSYSLHVGGNIFVTASDARIYSYSTDNGSYAGFTAQSSGGSGGFHLLSPVTGSTSHVTTVSNYDTYLSTRNANNLILATANTERVRITAGGSVGIGTTNPFSNSPLHTYRSLGSNYLSIQADPGPYDAAMRFTDGTNNVYAGMMSGSTNLTGAYTIWTGGNARVNVTSAGNVGIGTTNPYVKLSVNGLAQFGNPNLQTSGTEYIIIGQNSSTGPDDGNSSGIYVNHASPTGSSTIKFTYQFRQNDNSGANLYGDAIRATKDAGANSTFTTFYTNSTIGSGTERMRISNTGTADIRIGGNYSYHAAANRGTVNINGASTAILSFSTGASAVKGYLYHNGDYMELWNQAASSYLAFGNDASERLRIGPLGDMGAMGNTVAGQGVSQANYRNFYWGAGIIMGRDAYDSYLCGNIYYDGSWKLKYGGYYGNVVNWYGGEYSFQTSTSNGSANSAVSLLATLFLDRNGNAVFRGSVTQNGSPSDISLKENLVKITSPLEKISQINGYNFDWKEGTHANGLTIPVAEGMQAPESPLVIAHDAGLIAQEVEEIMPELVRDNGHKALNYNGIVALLVESVKELKAQNDSLITRIEQLESK